FISSRRRHTISKRDWSSDVCSSDLDVAGHCIRICYCYALDIQHKTMADDKRSNIFDIAGRYIMPAADERDSFGSLQQGDGTARRYTGVDMFMVSGTMYNVEGVILYCVVDLNC